MRSRFVAFLVFVLCSVFSTQLFAQQDNDKEDVNYEEQYDQDQSRLDNYYVETDETFFNDRNRDQNNAFLNHEDPFPGRPKDMWEASIKLGFLAYQGTTPNFSDSKGFLGFMAGAAVRKSLGYVVSLRGEYQYKTSNTSDLSISQHNIFADMVFSLNNVNFHRSELDHNIYIFAGPGVGFNNNKCPSSTIAGDNIEETATDLMVSAGVGFSQRLSKFSIGADLRLALPFSVSRGEKPLVTEYATTANYVTLAFHFDIPIASRTRTESLWWKNPLIYPYSELNIPKHQKTFKVRFKDEDEDGVPDDFDKEPNTRKGCPVNPSGITLDTDKDGVPDCDDLEPITPTRCQPVNDDGIGKCPEPRINQMNVNPEFAFDTNMPAVGQNNYSLVDTDKDGVPDMYDKEPNTRQGCPVDAQGKLLDTDQDGVPDCYDMEVITPSYCRPVNESGVGNCLTSNCCEGLKFKDPQKYDNYQDSLRDKQRKLDSLEKELNKGIDNLKNRLNQSNHGTVESKNGKTRISLNNDILFESGSANLKPKVMPVLEEVAKLLKENPDFDVMVEGHTDNVPIHSKIFRDNWALSNARSLAVVRVLSNKYQIDPARLSSAGRGEYVPVADNATAEGRAMNRRIEINLIPKK